MLRLLLALLLAAPAAHAQFAIGGQIGEPTGLAFKAGTGRGALIGAVGFDLSADRLSADAHYLLGQSRLDGASSLRTLYGPGVFVNSNNDTVNAGLSLVLGLELGLAREVDAFLHGTPRLQLIDETDVDVDAALGLRVHIAS